MPVTYFNEVDNKLITWDIQVFRIAETSDEQQQAYTDLMTVHEDEYGFVSPPAAPPPPPPVVAANTSSTWTQLKFRVQKFRFSVSWALSVISVLSLSPPFDCLSVSLLFHCLTLLVNTIILLDQKLYFYYWVFKILLYSKHFVYLMWLSFATLLLSCLVCWCCY